MKKFYSFLVVAFSAITISAQSAGVFESYVVLKVGTGGTDKFYDLQASTSNPDFPGANLGTFYTDSSLIVSGGQNKIFKCNGGDVTAGTTYYRLYKATDTPSGTFTEIPMTFLSNDAGATGNCQNQTWQGLSGTTNLISGLTPGNYKLEVYTSASSNLGVAPGYIYSNNNGNNYVASFSVTNVLSAADYVGNSKKSIVSEGKLITSKKGNLSLTVYDFSGKIVKTINAKGDGNAIDLNIAQRGLYMVKLTDGSTSEVVKFVK